MQIVLLRVVAAQLVQIVAARLMQMIVVLFAEAHAALLVVGVVAVARGTDVLLAADQPLVVHRVHRGAAGQVQAGVHGVRVCHRIVFGVQLIRMQMVRSELLAVVRIVQMAVTDEHRVPIVLAVAVVRLVVDERHFAARRSMVYGACRRIVRDRAESEVRR